MLYTIKRLSILSILLFSLTHAEDFQNYLDVSIPEDKELIKSYYHLKKSDKNYQYVFLKEDAQKLIEQRSNSSYKFNFYFQAKVKVPKEFLNTNKKVLVRFKSPEKFNRGQYFKLKASNKLIKSYESLDYVNNQIYTLPKVDEFVITTRIDTHYVGISLKNMFKQIGNGRAVKVEFAFSERGRGQDRKWVNSDYELNILEKK